MTTIRVMPRRLAPVSFGLFNILIGFAKMADPHSKSFGLSKVPGSLTAWGAIYVALGLLIIAGCFFRWVAWTSAFSGIFLWWMWADFVHEARLAHPAYVTISGWVTPFAIGGLHAMLAPYYRNPKMDTPK